MVAHDESSVEVVVANALRAHETGTRRQAIAAINAALDLAPDRPDLHVAHARALWDGAGEFTPYATSGRGYEGRRALETALALDPNHPQAHFLLGWAAVQGREWGAARRHLTMAAEHDPSYSAGVDELLAQVPKSGTPTRATGNHLSRALGAPPVRKPFWRPLGTLVLSILVVVFVGDVVIDWLVGN
ncbi:tetratricopeptide repeat protein [Nocardia camponoti]|uniref:Tetratricopeptide repeat protein n=1 Tax=Nocardia camponoti TaxID=1616106 RepID=A0A917QSQ9_9NOCA|nr:tetratricopeptide repeat protein [Nocardia camponoti]GGK66412.1 hypothetical protein GCM10011591_43200 [Nocardia camponoti]